MIVLTEEDVFAAVTEIAARISGLPQANISDVSTLKGTLGMNRPDLVYFANEVTTYIQRYNSRGALTFEVANKKDQTVGGTAREAFDRIKV